jgi:hypothetical protein
MAGGQAGSGAPAVGITTATAAAHSLPMGTSAATVGAPAATSGASDTTNASDTTANSGSAATSDATGTTASAPGLRHATTTSATEWAGGPDPGAGPDRLSRWWRVTRK